jgi:DNA-binding CsgD family transcriptional regulator
MRALHALTCIGGDYAAISSAYKEICQRVIKMGNITTIVTCLLGIGATLAAQGQFVSAVRLWGKTKVLYDPVNRTISELKAYAWVALALRIHLDHDQIAVTVQAQLDEQSFTAAWNEGQAMSLEQLLDSPTTDVLPQQPPTPPSVHTAAPPVKLTRREREVLRLVAQGLTDAQIAEQLVITKRTVNWYLTSIYSKFGVSSRLAATQFAREHHLLD